MHGIASDGPAQRRAAPAAVPLEARGLAFGYGRANVWEGVDLTLHAGEVALLTGANGSGKSTLLRCLAGWLSPRSGEILVEGRPFRGERAPRRAIAFVSDVPAFYDDLTAREHIEFVLRAGRYGEREQARANELLDAFGLMAHLDRYPSAFSRGMRQKLALVVGLMATPPVLLLDEPTGPLDPPSVEVLGGEVARAASEGSAVLTSCHHAFAQMRPNAVWELRGDGLHASGPLSEDGERSGASSEARTREYAVESTAAGSGHAGSTTPGASR